MREHPVHLSFVLRMLDNQVKDIVIKSASKSERAPQSHLQGGIVGYLYHHREEPVYQKDIEKEFRISGATATNTLRVMEKNGLIKRKNQDKDARLKRICMTQEAIASHQKFEEHMEWLDGRLIQEMSEDEVDELFRLLGIVKNNLDRIRSELSQEGIKSDLGQTEESFDTEKKEKKDAENISCSH